MTLFNHETHQKLKGTFVGLVTFVSKQGRYILPDSQNQFPFISQYTFRKSVG